MVNLNELRLLRSAATSAILVYEQVTDKRNTAVRVFLGLATLDALIQAYTKESELVGKVVTGALLRSWVIPALMLAWALEPNLGPRRVPARQAAVLAIVWLSFLSEASEVQDTTSEATDSVVDAANATLTWDDVLRVPPMPTLDAASPYTQKRAAVAAIGTGALLVVWMRGVPKGVGGTRPAAMRYAP
tara:strand:+ start:4124 stop:4687 length:564 start_codon:yes stop_codon:yes gene_type:complete